MDLSSRHLVFHAAVVLLIGLLYGAPYAKAIKRGAAAQIVNSWRVAHLSIPLGATLMFAIAAVLPSFTVSAGFKWSIVGALLLSSYAFCLATPLAVITSDRGLASGAKGLARLVYLGNMVGAGSSLLAAALLVCAGFISLW
ncbi:hypothetical protein BCF11_0079 [Collimonas sp. PA-H2]|uniref:hypothetical protein n=1 Tax=Collimonas sp. PA-H2 TaxID=1881062 RepID=UPI000BF26D95|nr:hypothetical protein [Collimonas sp. PA-H2]PFH07741.1 hypothetical protein BCF11_0079 [Collimonas sp. PA-H2]